jgi:formate/nitrite transporter FocA (FNT family)
MGTGALKCGILAIGCGFIMTTAVQFARQNQFLPLIFGVPLFIVCGFPHCVADAFYYALTALQGNWEWWILPACGWAILGNYIGCNLPRWFMGELFEAN